MNKKMKQLLVLLGCFIVIMIAYIGTTIVLKNQEEKEEILQSKEEEANTIAITNMDNVSEVSYNNGSESLSFVKKEDTWYYKEDEAFPLEQSYITDLVETASKLQATRKLENGDTLQDYGLEEPDKTVTLADENGNHLMLNIGNSVNGDYYLYVSGNESVVYTVSSDLLSKIDYSLYDLMKLEEIPTITESNIKEISIVEENSDILLKPVVNQDDTIDNQDDIIDNEENTIETQENTEAITESDDTQSETVNWIKMENGASEDITNSTQITDILNNLSSLAFESCTNYNASKEQLESCGLSSQSRQISIMYNDEETVKTVVLNIGNVDDSGEYYYATMDDSTAIYLIDKEVIAPFFE